ncbi:MAG: site-specific integrase [Cyclobacteriaceae bacterium]|nr:site-specific integrase [Cyclobacteriaceae bacterium]MCH8516383.1 site-specific integrase [Cyclobacteriaceae bacterium]
MAQRKKRIRVSYLLKKNIQKDGKAPLFLILSLDSKRNYYSLNIKVEVKRWLGSSRKISGTSPEVTKINDYLDSIRLRVIEIYERLTAEDKSISADVIFNELMGVKEEERKLSELIDYHMESEKSKLAPGTLKNYYTTARYLFRFIEANIKTEDIELKKINPKFIYEFEYFLRKWQPKDHHKPLNNNGIMKHMERFRKLINLAMRLEWIEKDPFINFSPKFEKVDRECLTQEELEYLEEKDFRNERLELVRDIFVFSCYTGLAYIDVVNLSSDNIHKGIDGSNWIISNRQKSQTQFKVPLLPKAEEILEKYEGHPKTDGTKQLLPIASNQKTNAYLKEIAHICGIRKNLTFHLARHTFATTVTLSNGVPIESVSKMLGHTKISTTQVYAKVLEKKLSEDMSALKVKLATRDRLREEDGVFKM